ncbi:hypothetical protein JAAARDRAFT_660602 [Jaapia argillacea MUCL 33604]|uniref:Uncharacterized protein n=1 Tax=Jaapia argillacea MUCL 33604 TaxID=933084 RepID=A0A067Q9W1_9AGAM|nr:hypothetical protein JAAARDRAFT_660602 [Jaapia argillacea MUCL 33604]
MTSRLYRGVEQAISKYTPDSESGARLVLSHWLDLIAGLPPPRFTAYASSGINLGDVIFCDDILPWGEISPSNNILPSRASIFPVLGSYSTTHTVARSCGPVEESDPLNTRPKDVDISSLGGNHIQGSSRISSHCFREGWTSLEYEHTCSRCLDKSLCSRECFRSRHCYPNTKQAFAELSVLGKHTAAKYGHPLHSIGIVQSPQSKIHFPLKTWMWKRRQIRRCLQSHLSCICTSATRLKVYHLQVIGRNRASLAPMKHFKL